MERSGKRPFGLARTGLAALVILAVVAPAFADPPPWAPAHGYRDKHKGKGHKHKGRDYETAYVVPFGINMGRCNREEIGAVLGAAVGGYIGSQVAEGDAKNVAIVGGAVVGAIVGGQIGRNMDKADHYCVGQALEYAEEGRPVSWTDGNSNVRYRVMPLETYRSGWKDQYCRRFSTTANIDGYEQTTLSTACRTDDGVWQMLK